MRADAPMWFSVVSQAVIALYQNFRKLLKRSIVVLSFPIMVSSPIYPRAKGFNIHTLKVKKILSSNEICVNTPDESIQPEELV